MHMATVTMLPVNMRVSETSVIDWIERQGVRVIDADLPGGLWGAYSLARGLIAIHTGLSASQRLFALIHESIHVQNQHDGHQDEKVERRVDEETACLMIDRVDYMWAETQYGWNTRALAIELDVPRKAVQAYRRVLEREQCEPHGAGSSNGIREVGYPA
jgi:hypothetical protein